MTNWPVRSLQRFCLAAFQFARRGDQRPGSAAQTLFQQLGHGFIESGATLRGERVDLLDQVAIELDRKRDQPLRLVKFALLAAIQCGRGILSKSTRRAGLVDPVGD